MTPLKPPTDSGQLYELRWYRAQVGRLGEWLNLAKGCCPCREKYSRNVGYWQTEAGQLNEVVHLWVYKDLNDARRPRPKALAPIPTGRSLAARQRLCRCSSRHARSTVAQCPTTTSSSPATTVVEWTSDRRR